MWQRTQRKHFAGGLLAFARWFVPLFFVAIIIDRFAYLPGWLRAVGALALLAVGIGQGMASRLVVHAWIRCHPHGAND